MTVPFRLFVTGTDTGVGKTQVSCALLSLLADRGLSPAPFKPYESGCARLSSPADALALKASARSEDLLENISPHRFRPPLAPGVAAARLGVEPDFKRTLRAFRAFDGRNLVVEGAGGLLVPIDSRRDVVDLIAQLQLPVLLVARAGLGTLNHTGLSVQALAQRRIRVAAVVLAHAVPGKDPAARDNAEWIRRRHGVEVLGPVLFHPDERSRLKAYRRVLAPWLEARL